MSCRLRSLNQTETADFMMSFFGLNRQCPSVFALISNGFALFPDMGDGDISGEAIPF
jgi:hypothetical protein